MTQFNTKEQAALQLALCLAQGLMSILLKYRHESGGAGSNQNQRSKSGIHVSEMSLHIVVSLVSILICSKNLKRFYM